MTYAVILAGGVGSRFWPRSRKHKPKQMLNIFGNNTLLQETITRISPLVATEQTLIVTTRELVAHLKKQLVNFQDNNFLVEPIGRNTAPCIGLAALRLLERDPEALMIILPADHMISDGEHFIGCLRQALDTAQQYDSLVTIGIKPTHPETGYGYVQFNPQQPKATGAYEVVTFAEKPHIDTARRFVASGDFLWNSGMFIWSARRILTEIEVSMPELYTALMEIQQLKGPDREAQFDNIYGGIRSLSVDYGIMERASNVAVVKGDFAWTDVGNWAEVYRLSPKDEHGNANLNGHVLIDTRNCYVDSPDHFVALVGVQDLVIINTGDALLICHRERAQEVKKAVEYMERHHLDQYL